MQCEFCASPFPDADEPVNLALLGHVRESPECGVQLDHLIENLNTSWTPNMSGG